MNTFTSRAAQGEIQIRRVDHIPLDCTPLNRTGDHYVIGHSETGHHHVLRAEGASVAVLEEPSLGMRILYAALDQANALEHLRDHDSHRPIMLLPGVYEFRICREFDPFTHGIRGQAD